MMNIFAKAISTGFAGAVSLAFVLTVAGCQQAQTQSDGEESVTLFSESKPYTVEIRWERGFFQAQSVACRLNKMDVEAYVLSVDTADGRWYSVVSGALADSAAVENYKALLDTGFNLKVVRALNYSELDSAMRVPVTEEAARVTETKRITANKPDVPKCVTDVAAKFPGVKDMFQLNTISLLPLTPKAISSSKGKALNMPRGITLQYLRQKGCLSVAAVIYQDNLYSDKITLHAVKCADKKEVAQASLLPVPTERNEAAYAICGECADGQKREFKLQAFQKLSGYRVSFTQRGKPYTYYILTDEAGEYIYLGQSNKANDREAIEFFAEIGKSEGLVVYDEFYNSFYTVADRQIDDDEFLGYYIDKLTREYATMRGNASWARKMVGMWHTSLYFDNPKKGIWHAGLFDLVSNTSGKHVYGDLYLKGLDASEKRTIYGVSGAAIPASLWAMGEVNFGRGRYIVAINGDSYAYSERDLIERAGRLQLTQGGYSKPSGTDNSSTQKRGIDI